MNYNKIRKKMGRPIVWPEPNTDIAKRLHDILPRKGMAVIGREFFGGLSDVGVKSILSGTSEPPPSALVTIAEQCDCDLMWLLTGDKETGKQKPSANKTEGQGIIQRLYATLEEAHGALSDISVEVNNNRLPADMGLQAVEEALDTLLKVHGKAAKADKRRRSKEDTRGTDKTA